MRTRGHRLPATVVTAIRHNHGLVRTDRSGRGGALPEGTETFILLGRRIALERLEPESRPLKTVEPGVELVEVHAGSSSPVITRAYSTSRVRGTSTTIS